MLIRGVTATSICLTFCFFLAVFGKELLTSSAAEVCYQPINLTQKDPVLDKWFTDIQKNFGFSGTVLIADRGEVIHAGEYGYGNLRTKDTLTQMSSFQLASVSKMITATAIMTLYDSGKIDFDEEVCAYLQGFPYDGLTIRHLLNHRSGLPRYMAVVDKHWEKDSALTHKDVVDLYCQHHPNLFFNPGNGFNYNNTNYVLLAAIVERVSNQSFADYVQEYIFNPIGMSSSRVVGRPGKVKFENETIGYKRRWRRFHKAWNDNIDEVTGDKGIYSSSFDMLLFDQALHSGQIVHPATLAEAYKNGSPNRTFRQYGFGLRLKPGKDKIVYHFGWWRGFRTCYIRDLTHEKTIIVLANRDSKRGAHDYWGIYDKVMEIDSLHNPIEIPSVREFPFVNGFLSK